MSQYQDNFFWIHRLNRPDDVEIMDDSEMTTITTRTYEVVHQYTDSPQLFSATGETSETHTATVAVESIGDAYKTQCEELHENCNVFEVIELCSDCQGSNLNEDKTKCWDCAASDYQGGN